MEKFNRLVGIVLSFLMIAIGIALCVISFRGVFIFLLIGLMTIFIGGYQLNEMRKNF